MSKKKPEKVDISIVDPKNPKNPLNTDQRPKAVTEEEIHFLNTIDPRNPKNQPQKGGEMPESNYGYEDEE